MSSKSPKPAKLCKRSYFLRSETVPRQTQMRQELGPNLADVILEQMSPACKAWMGVDRSLQGPSSGFCVDSDQLRANIHEHILDVGKKAEERVERRRRRQLAKRQDRTEEFELLKFECRQKIEIARDEERKRMQELLREAEWELAEKFRAMKVELGEDYLRGRREMAQFMCRNMRKQAFELIGGISRQYRIELEREVTKRVDEEVEKMAEQIDEVVQRAVERQQHIDTEAMRRMCYRYEELMKNQNHRSACRQLTELSQQICARWAETTKKPDSAEICCQTSFIIPKPSEEIESESVVQSKGFEEPSEPIEKEDIFVIESCFMKPGPSPVYSFADSIAQEEVAPSSSTLEAFALEDQIYAQPKYYRKIHEQLFPTAEPSWEPPKIDEISEIRIEEPSLAAIDSDFAREVVKGILSDVDLSEEEISYESSDVEEVPRIEW
ncbi:hypothetical protein pipiens_016063 [Culex pipiens pipiens]|uniref:Uncharacterized protein n=2 Tax=Culex pipiens pipiens TaxID=38569 RepID=A0ABD1CMU9_CULPP